MPAIDEYIGANNGQHVIHTGGDHASYLQLPIRQPDGDAGSRNDRVGDRSQRQSRQTTDPEAAGCRS